ncbi:MAG: hypothetical protein UHY68_06885 [Acutalibacteraceae bacterium]|nr:hypothetical protein [Acutalibacteraceae bacterium]
MKKVHLGFCFGLWALWVRGMWLIGILFLVTLFDGFFNTFYSVTFFWNIVEPFASFMLLFPLLPIEPILFIITLIAEIPKWKKKSFLTVVLPFFITGILYMIYMCVFVVGTGGV